MEGIEPMFRSFGARLLTALMLGALFLSAVAAPAAAATRTRWVDDDNKRGDGPKACNNANFSSIQAAIDASSAWDKVYVCPGNYREQITIDKRGLEVRSVPALGAKLWPPETLTEVDFTTSIVHITARDVQLVGFWLKFEDGDVEIPPPVRPQGEPSTGCEIVDAAIWAEAPHATIKANHIKTVGDNTLSGDCGYLFGIVLADPLIDDVGGAWGPDTSLVWRNWVKDFKYGGILLGGDRAAKLWNNNIRYVHYDDPATCNLVPVLGVNPSLDFPCRGPLVQNTSPLDGLFPYGAGIMVEGSLVDLRGNTVYSTLDTSLLEIFDILPTFLAAGIVLIDPTDGSRMRSNIVDNTFFGIAMSEDFIFFPGIQPVPDAPDGVAVSGNRVSETFVGFAVESDDNYFYANRAHLNIFGMWAGEDSAGNTFDHNDFRYNGEVDCLDESDGGTGDYGTDNYWTEPNLGFESYPTDLCMPFFPVI